MDPYNQSVQDELTIRWDREHKGCKEDVFVKRGYFVGETFGEKNDLVKIS